MWGKEMETFRDRVNGLLGERTMAWLARAADVNSNTIANYIYRNSMPRMDHLVKIAKALGVSVDYLSTGEGEAKVQSPKVSELTAYLCELSEEELDEAIGCLKALRYLRIRQERAESA